MSYGCASIITRITEMLTPAWILILCLVGWIEGISVMRIFCTSRRIGSLNDILNVIGYSILFMTPFTAPSHSSFFKPVIRELADRGHSITYWSGLRPPPPSASSGGSNGTSSWSTDVRLLFSEQLSGRYNFDQHGIGWSTVDHPFELFFTLSDRLAQTCSAMYRDPVFLHLKNSSMDQYDLIVVDAVSQSFDLFLRFRSFGFVRPSLWSDDPFLPILG